MPTTRGRSDGSSGRLPLAQVLVSISLATDLGTGQPLEHAWRTCLLAQELAQRSGVAADRLSDVYYLALLRFVGCTADSSPTARQVGGDDIGFVAHMAPALMGSRGEQLRALVQGTARGETSVNGLLTRARMVADLHGAERAIRSHCEAAQLLSVRLGVGAGVTDALGHAFERWDGRGIPGEVSEAAVPAPVRVVVVARDLDLWITHAGLDTALEVLARRAGHAYDPAVVAAFTADPNAVLAAVTTEDTWQAVIDAEPRPPLEVRADELTVMLGAFADFADLKSPWLRGHSRAVAEMARDAARVMGLDSEETTELLHAGLVHDLGRVGVPSGIWDKPGPLTTSEWEKVRLHPYLTERVLSRSSALAPLARLAARHHERADGSGYHRGATAPEVGPTAQVLAVADHYRSLTEARPYRSAYTPADAATRLRADASAGLFGEPFVEAVLEAAGHPTPHWSLTNPAGLTDREVDVLQRIAVGLSNRQVAEALGISAKTVGAHVEHIYAKAGISTRAGAALFAMEHHLLRPRG